MALMATLDKGSPQVAQSDNSTQHSSSHLKAGFQQENGVFKQK